MENESTEQHSAHAYSEEILESIVSGIGHWLQYLTQQKDNQQQYKQGDNLQREERRQECGRHTNGKLFQGYYFLEDEKS